ncbi:hypothetical protein [Massilia niastensis]|uniref:hypothetical protein n=1 Tax=Massilia niastensis TaxID=544911 RepID=UPI0003A807DA|nr:hypothetical protein [Massilia niastensis]
MPHFFAAGASILAWRAEVGDADRRVVGDGGLCDHAVLAVMRWQAENREAT